MSSTNSQMLNLALSFVKAIEEGKTGEELSKFYDVGIEQIEYPNTLTKNLTVRDLADLKEASLKGQKILTKQTYDIVNSFVSGNTVILEARRFV